jgi:transcriptional regulator with XRE-family HTH domain
MSEVDFYRLGRLLANHRLASKLRQEDLARDLGIHPVTLSRIEHGKLPGLSVEMLTRLALRLDVSLDLLVDWSPGKRLTEALAQAEQEYEARLKKP